MQPKLGIIAGGGALPQRVIDVCQKSGRAYHVIAITGYTANSVVAGTPHSWVNLSRAGRAIKILKKENVKEVLMIGDVKSPSLFKSWPDFWTFKLLAKLTLRSIYSNVGDNIRLTVLSNQLEKLGFIVIGIQEIIADLLAPKGLLSSVPVKEEFFKDIKFGISVALKLGRRDIGQAVIIKSCEVIAEEGKNGTARMIKDSYPDCIGGVLIKLKKPHQDRRLDLPTVGVETVLQASEAGLAGIIIEAGETIVVDIDSVASMANEKGIFIQSVDVDKGA